MVLEFYKLKEQPFGATPDPDYLYLSPTHSEALASILYAIRNRRGFMSLVATPGMGKTTLLLQLLKQLEGSARTAFLFQTMCGPEDLLRSLLEDLGVSSSGASIVALQGELHGLLLAEAQKGRRVVVVIDEAQNLSDSSLELVRMLSNFETTKDKLVQIVLAGQPQLREQLASPALLQLRQRIAMSARLDAFNEEETRLYIDHRLRRAGYSFATPLFAPDSVALIAKNSEGIPRNINNICFTALTLGAGLKQRTIQCGVICEALKELDLSESGPDEASIAPVGQEIFASTTSMLNTPSGGFRWRPQFAAVALLLLALTLGINPRIQKLSGIHVSPAGVAAMSASTPPSSSAEKHGLEDSNSGSVGAQAEVSAATPSVDAPLTTEVTTAEKPTPESRNYKQLRETSTDDPAKLWAQVKMSDSDAEVKLARMFLEGTGVAQNCAQAELLLLDASRKGNSQASSLLSDHPCQ
jgi:type II secretory pathway predicted ATPase ExeA